MDQDGRAGFIDGDDGDTLRALETTLQPEQGNAGLPAPLPAVAPVQFRARLVSFVRALLQDAPAAFAGGRRAAPHLHDDDADVIPPPALLLVAPPPAPVQVRARLVYFVRALLHEAPAAFAVVARAAHLPARACLLALLREAPAAFAVAAAYRSVADDGDLGLAAWARFGCLYPCTLLVAGAAATTLAGATHLRTVRHAVVPARACLVSAVGALLREAPAAFAVAAAYGYGNVADDGDLGLSAWTRCVLVYTFLVVARTSAVRAAAVLAGHPLAAAQGLRPSHAVRDIVVLLLAVAAVLAAIHFP